MNAERMMFEVAVSADRVMEIVHSVRWQDVERGQGLDREKCKAMQKSGLKIAKLARMLAGLTAWTQVKRGLIAATARAPKGKR